MTIFCDYPFPMRAKIVIDQSMTFSRACFKIVIDRSMTIFCDYPFPMQSEIVIDQSDIFTFLEGCFKIVIDRSMTIL